MLESAQAEAKVRAQRAAQQTAEEARSELGEWAFELLEEYFPEEAQQRRRQERVSYPRLKSWACQWTPLLPSFRRRR